MNNYYFERFLLFSVKLLTSCYFFYKFLHNNSILVVCFTWSDLNMIVTRKHYTFYYLWGTWSFKLFVFWLNFVNCISLIEFMKYCPVFPTRELDPNEECVQGWSNILPLFFVEVKTLSVRNACVMYESLPSGICWFEYVNCSEWVDPVHRWEYLRISHPRDQNWLFGGEESDFEEGDRVGEGIKFGSMMEFEMSWLNWSWIWGSLDLTFGTFWTLKSTVI